MRESIKGHFKDNASSEIGPLWQDYGNFCQMPDLANSDQDIIYCRKLQIYPELLENNCWVLQIVISTKSLDGRTFADYYRSGEVGRLAEWIRLKRESRLTRQNKPPEVRVWCSAGGAAATVRELDNPDEIMTDSELNSADQRAKADQTLLCRPYKKPPISVPLDEIRLIPDAAMAQERHQETIIDPDERSKWYGTLRDFLNGLDAYGKTISLAEQPVDAREFDNIQFKPPELRVKNFSRRH